MQAKLVGSELDSRYTAESPMPTRIARHHGRRCQLTPRDVAVFEAIDRHPFTTDQLYRLSATFTEPFTQGRLLRRRLQQLREARLLQSWPLATVGRGGAPHYWKLARAGYQWLQGDEAALPSRRFFEEIAPGHHHHTRCLGDFLVQTFVAAHRRGIVVRHFARENSVTLEAGGFIVVPDCAFQLHTPDGRSFHFCVELDNGTERVRSRLDVESIERKLRGYDAHQSQFAALDPQRYLVLFVTTRSRDRLTHILDLAGRVMRNPQRTVFVGVALNEYLNSDDPCGAALLTDHRGLQRSLVSIARANTEAPSRQVKITSGVC